MEKENNSVRERLLGRLPQPENLAAYREETASLLAKHERALFWEKWTAKVIYFCAVGVIMTSIFIWGPWGGGHANIVPYVTGFLLFFGAGYAALRYYIYRSKVDILKEVKQIQLQLLELQATLNKSGDQKL